MRSLLPAFPLLVFVLLLLGAIPAGAAHLDLWPEAEIEIGGDFIGGYFHDDALGGTAGRETQTFKMSRGLLKLDIQHDSGWGGLLEYNVFPDQPERDDNDRMTDFDWYNNLGTDLYYFGDFKVRNGYLRWLSPERQWQVRAGRMVNIIGFEEEEVPFWGRLDSPHAHFLTKEILNGIAIAWEIPWLRFEVAGLDGRGRPDSDYNWYLNGLCDPNTGDNSDVMVEAELVLRWRDLLAVSAGYHEGKTGSAPGSIFSGKHNDDRLVFGLRSVTPPLGRWGVRLHLLGQYSQFDCGLTSDGQQGATTTVQSRDLDKDGWFATGGVSLLERAAVYLTYEELDRIDSLVWAEIAQFDPNHWSLDSVERSTIVHATFGLNRWVTLYGFYRTLDFDFGEISGIYRKNVAAREYDKYGLVLRVMF
ncbi:MAG: hypothetical protein IH614_03945 [Desulfuromonadales bacterium]|nr:hypothetical protein [Desulfuromonadales bacterium]